MIQGSWKNKIFHPSQLGGIETSVLDSGPGKGTRIAWVNTGTGLRYKVVIDRALDIADAFNNEHSLTWISQLGVVPPQALSNRGLEWLKTFTGGLLLTCGLDHVGGPESDEYGERGLHGPISNIAAEIESIIQPDPANGKLDMSITGKVNQFRIFGPNLELRRTISGTLGKPLIRIHDEVTNRGNTPAPHMILYHCNFGWPLIDEGTRIIWNGSWQSREAPEKRKIFVEGNNFRTCPPPLDDHAGTGEEAAYIDTSADASGQSLCGLYNESLQLAVSLRYPKKQLPWLTNWQHWGRGEYVTGMEPGTHPPMGQAKARAQNLLIHLQPGESRSYDLEIEVMSGEEQVAGFLHSTKAG